MLADWQYRDIIEPLFGTLRADGLRQYRTSYIEIPRKNGKSTLCAGIALYLLMADGEKGAEIVSAAADREQASIVFDIASSMVQASPMLASRCTVLRKEIVTKNGSRYRAISADAHTKHGFNCSGIIFDELHAQPNRELWDVLTTSVGSRRQPLTVAITTAGHDRNSLCYEMHQHARSVLMGDSIHAFGDGLLVAAAFLADVQLGVAATVAVLAHEVPHHMGDLVVLQQGMGQPRSALIKLCMAGGVTVLGGLVGYSLIAGHEEWLPFWLTLASSSYIYVALADLIPQLQKRLSASATSMQVLWLLAGIGLVTLATQLMHVH